jgi:hypothetical protein
LLIGMPLSPENVCSQFNPPSLFVVQGLQAPTGDKIERPEQPAGCHKPMISAD